MCHNLFKERSNRKTFWREPRLISFGWNHPLFCHQAVSTWVFIQGSKLKSHFFPSKIHLRSMYKTYTLSNKAANVFLRHPQKKVGEYTLPKFKPRVSPEKQWVVWKTFAFPFLGPSNFSGGELLNFGGAKMWIHPLSFFQRLSSLNAAVSPIPSYQLQPDRFVGLW